MEPSFDIFLTCLPRDVTENVIRNLFKTVGNVSKVKIIEDKKNENYKLCFVGFGSMDEAMEAVRLADKSTAFGDPIKASVSKKSLDGYDSQQKPKQNNDYKRTGFNSLNESPNSKINNDVYKPSFNNDNESPKGFNNVGRGRGMQIKREIIPPSFVPKPINLTDIKLKSRELIEVEIIDLSNLELICARPLKHTENSKVEITDLLLKVNSAINTLHVVESPKVGDCYLGKWDDEMYYRAELIECLKDGTFMVTFVDEGTSGDIVSDLKCIPEGPLQQYPKQFTKITLGCKNSDDLRNFIINESLEKKVNLFWLGECLSGIPLVNLFLNEDEIVEKFILLNKNHIRESFALKFKDMPNHKAETDCSNVTFIQSMYKSQSDFTVQIKEPTAIKCLKKVPMILPVPGDICIYEKRNGVNNVTYLRCVVRRRQLFSFDILLFDLGENLNNVSIDCLYAAEEIHKLAPPYTIICELDKSLGYTEDSFQKVMSDDNMKFSIVTYKGNNRYFVTISVVKKSISHYPETILKNFLGQSHKVLVTHLVSPLNFFVQINKAEYVQTLNEIHEKLNISYSGPRFTSLDSLKAGQAVIAPFSVDSGVGENFRATVVEKRQQAPQVHVFYIDYGNDGWVDFKQLLDVDEDVVSRAALAINCTLNVDVRKEATNHAIELFSKLVGFSDNDSGDLVMQVSGEYDSKLIIDLTCVVKGSIAMALDKSGTCFLKEDKGKSAKPICNGDIKREIKIEISNDLQSAGIKREDVEHKSLETEDYASLLKKVNDLEQRLAYLEKKTAQSNY